MFQALLQLMLFGLLIYIVWNSLSQSKDDIKPRAYLAWFGFILVLIFIIWSFTKPNDAEVIDFATIITFPLTPLGLPLFLLFLAIAGGIKNGGITKEAAAYVQAAFGILVFFSLPIVAAWFAQQGEFESLNATQVVPRLREPVSAIVLLGQRTTQLNLLSPNQIQLTDASDRILATAREYDRQRSLGGSPVVIVSAGRRSGYDENPNVNLVEARDIARILVQMGIPQDNILLNPTGVDFRTSAVAVKQFIDEGRIEKRVALVAPALGMQRARQTFALLGIETIPIPAGFLTFQSGTTPRILVNVLPSKVCKNTTNQGTTNIIIRNVRPFRLADFISNADSLLITTRVVNEFWSSVYYLLRGWIATGGAEPVISRAVDTPC